MRLIFAAAIVLGGILTGCSGKSNPNAISGSGTIEATEVNVASKIAGQVQVLKVDEGAIVNDSSEIAEIDHTNYDIQLEEAKASLEQVQAQANLAKEGARIEDIRASEDALAQAKANQDIAKEDLNREEQLLKSDATTRAERDNAKSKLDALTAQVQQAEQNVEKTKRLTRPSELAQAEARVAQAQATVDRYKQLISDCYVLSPLHGVVTHKVVEQGEVVGTGATIATVTEIGKVNLMIYVTEEELPKVKLVQQAKVWIDGMPEKTYMGNVVYISPEAEFTPKNIQTKDDRVKLVFGVKIEVPDPKADLKRGLPADAEILVR
jgi:HlyD family secretion protein